MLARSTAALLAPTADGMLNEVWAANSRGGGVDGLAGESRRLGGAAHPDRARDRPGHRQHRVPVDSLRQAARTPASPRAAPGPSPGAARAHRPPLLAVLGHPVDGATVYRAGPNGLRARPDPTHRRPVPGRQSDV